MTPEQWQEFLHIAEQCEHGQVNTINVVSKVRSEAIIAARNFILEVMRTNGAVLEALRGREAKLKTQIEAHITAPNPPPPDS